MTLTFCISAVCFGCRAEVEPEERILRLTENGSPMDLRLDAPLSVTGRLIDADGEFAIASYGRHSYCFVLRGLEDWGVVTLKAAVYEALGRRVEVEGDFMGLVGPRKKNKRRGDFDPVPCDLVLRPRSISGL